LADTHYLLDVEIIVVKDMAVRGKLRTLNHRSNRNDADLPQNQVANQHTGVRLKARQKL